MSEKSKKQKKPFEAPPSIYIETAHKGDIVSSGALLKRFHYNSTPVNERSRFKFYKDILAEFKVTESTSREQSMYLHLMPTPDTVPAFCLISDEFTMSMFEHSRKHTRSIGLNENIKIIKGRYKLEGPFVHDVILMFDEFDTTIFRRDTMQCFRDNYKLLAAVVINCLPLKLDCMHTCSIYHSLLFIHLMEQFKIYSTNVSDILQKLIQCEYFFNQHMYDPVCSMYDLQQMQQFTRHKPTLETMFYSTCMSIDTVTLTSGLSTIYMSLFTSSICSTPVKSTCIIPSSEYPFDYMGLFTTLYDFNAKFKKMNAFIIWIVTPWTPEKITDKNITVQIVTDISDTEQALVNVRVLSADVYDTIKHLIDTSQSICIYDCTTPGYIPRTQTPLSSFMTICIIPIIDTSGHSCTLAYINDIIPFHSAIYSNDNKTSAILRHSELCFSIYDSTLEKKAICKLYLTPDEMATYQSTIVKITQKTRLYDKEKTERSRYKIHQYEACTIKKTVHESRKEAIYEIAYATCKLFEAKKISFIKDHISTLALKPTKIYIITPFTLTDKNNQFISIICNESVLSLDEGDVAYIIDFTSNINIFIKSPTSRVYYVSCERTIDEAIWYNKILSNFCWSKVVYKNVMEQFLNYNRELDLEKWN